MKQEIDALIRNRTWDLLDKQLGDNVIDSLWVFKVNEHPDESLDKLKHGSWQMVFRQIKGMDYHDTFSSVVKAVSICLVLTLTITNDWKLSQTDIGNVFLNGSLNEEF